MEEHKNKKIWLLVLLILVVVGVGIYFLAFNGESVPQPPALP